MKGSNFTSVVRTMTVKPTQRRPNHPTEAVCKIPHVRKSYTRGKYIYERVLVELPVTTIRS